MNQPQLHIDIVDGMIESMAQCLTPEVLEAIARQELTPEVTQRLGELATKANEGLLTADERAEYERSIDVGDILTILKLKARLRLKQAA